jgi:hypothetical protein
MVSSRIEPCHIQGSLYLTPANKPHLQSSWVRVSAHNHLASFPYLDSHTQKERFGFSLFLCFLSFFYLILLKAQKLQYCILNIALPDFRICRLCVSACPHTTTQSNDRLYLLYMYCASAMENMKNCNNSNRDALLQVFE